MSNYPSVTKKPAHKTADEQYLPPPSYDVAIASHSSPQPQASPQPPPQSSIHTAPTRTTTPSSRSTVNTYNYQPSNYQPSVVHHGPVKQVVQHSQHSPPPVKNYQIPHGPAVQTRATSVQPREAYIAQHTPRDHIDLATTCPSDGKSHDINNGWDPCGVLLGLVLFPVGIICCLLMRDKRCTKCGIQFKSSE